jgi:hypothetical protein
LQTLLPEAVEVARLIFVLVAVAAPAFAAGSFLTPRPVITSRSVLADTATWDELEDEKAVDAYGNEVSSAVAEYSLDAGGGSYELHSPQTDIPRLGSPES